MKIKFIALILFINSIAAQGSLVRCESLFQNSKLVEAAEKLALFRQEVVNEKDPRKKDLLNYEFSIQFAHFLRQAPDAERAKQLFQEIYESHAIDGKQKTLEDKKRDRGQYLNERSDQNFLHRWSHFLKIAPFGEKSISSTELTPDGSKILVKEKGGPGRKIYDAKTMQELHFQQDSRWEKNHSISSDSSTLFINYGLGQYRVIDLRTMTELEAPELKMPMGFEMQEFALSSDGSKLIYSEASFGANSTQVKFYDFKKKIYLPLPVSRFDLVSGLELFKDDSKLIVHLGSDHVPRIFDLNHQTEINIPNLPHFAYPKMTLSPDNKQIVVSWRLTPKQAYFDVNTLALEVVDFEISCPVPTYIPNTNLILQRASGYAFIFDPKSKIRSPDLRDSASSQSVPQLAVTSDGQYIFSAFGKSLKMRAQDLTELHWSLPDIDHIENLLVTPDGKKFIAQVNSNNLVVFFRDIEDAKPFTEIQVIP